MRWVRDAVEYPQHKKSSDIIREGLAFLTKTFDKEPKVPDVARMASVFRWADMIDDDMV